MSATASGANAQPNGSASNRDHKQGNQDRKYTIEQKTAVLRVKRCQSTAFYEILSIEKTASDGEIKKAYRKLSLLTHPDKNGYEGADEAFKMVSRAFQILSDVDKKARYDQFGGDPDSRFGSSSGAASSPFSGFARSPGSAAGRGGGFYEDEISPEELFNRFFGGGGGMGGGPFGNGMFGGGMGGGPGFMFSMNGGPGFTVHRMGGATPRRRPRGEEQAEVPPPSGFQALTQLLPLLLLFILPLLSSLFSGGTGSSGPSIRFDAAVPPMTMHRITPKYKVDYFVNPTEVDGFSGRKFHQLDQRAEVDYISNLQYNCEVERNTKSQMMQDAQGWFFSIDEDKVRQARQMPMRNCQRLDEMRIGRQY